MKRAKQHKNWDKNLAGDKIGSGANICVEGADFIDQFYGQVDAYLTGDSKYRHAKNAVDHGIVLVDINHHVENIMVTKLKELLEKEVNVDIITGSSPDYYIYR